LFVLVTLVLCFKVYLELQSGILTTRIIEALSLSAVSAAIIYVKLNNGLLAAIDFWHNQFFAFMMLTTLLVALVVMLACYRPVVLTTVIAVKRKLYSIGQFSNVLMIALLAISLAFAGLTNLHSTSSIGITWLDANAVWAVCIIFFLFILTVGAFSVTQQKIDLPTTCISTDNATFEKKQYGIQRIHGGIFGGMLGVCIAGLLMNTVTSLTEDYVGSGLILCGALGGLGFGALTKGDKKIRGLIGCIFGYIAIVFGLIMTYNTPIVIGYVTRSDVTAPLYMWHEITFLQFVEKQLLNAQGLTYAFFGLLAAYLCASNWSLKISGRIKVKKAKK
jgi:hypothetical protein